jgi:opacity protein-like surface antigen
MKKLVRTLLVALSLFFVASSIQAQTSFGVVGGLNLSKLSYNDLPNALSSNNRCGWYIGPKIEFKVPVIGIGIDASVEYSQRMMNGEGMTSDGYSSSQYLKTIEIPLNLRFNFGMSSIASVYAATGPQFGFNIGDRSWSWKDVNSNVDGFELKKSNVTWNIGAGVKLINHLEVGLGYNIALSKFAKRYAGDGNFKSNSWQFQLAYMF